MKKAKITNFNVKNELGCYFKSGEITLNDVKKQIQEMADFIGMMWDDYDVKFINDLLEKSTRDTINDLLVKVSLDYVDAKLQKMM